MQTNFFSALSSLQAKGEWTMHITQHDSDTITVSMRFKKPCGDKAAKIIPPLVFTAKPVTMMDNMFFIDLADASSKTDDVLSNMDHYLKELERANKASSKEQKNSSSGKTTVSKLSKYEEALKLVEDLEKKGKYQDAWMKVPDPSMFPDNAEFLRKKREELSQHFAPNLFGNIDNEIEDVPNDKQKYLEDNIPEELDDQTEEEQDFDHIEENEEEENEADDLPF